MKANTVSRLSQSYVTYAFCLLFIVNAFAAMDRSILSVLMPAIKADLALSDTELGLLSGLAFTLFYGLFAYPIGLLADRYSRSRVLALSLFIWSLMTAASGAAQNGVQLFLARMAVGIGEAGSLPSAHSLLSGYFPPVRRPFIFGLHTVGGILGLMLGLLIGGILAEQAGWRLTYVVVGLPGAAVAAIAWFTLRDPAPAKAANLPAGPGYREPANILELVRQRPAYLHVVLALTGGAIGAYGFIQWIPSFYVRTFDLSLSATGASTGLVTGVSSVLALLVGGAVSAVILKRWGAKAVTQCMAGCYVLAAVGFAAMFSSRDVTSALVFQALAVFFTLAALGPSFAMIQGISPPGIRAQAAAVMTLTINIIGGGLAPLAIGFSADYFMPSLGTESLRWVLFVGSGFLLWPVIHMLLAGRTVVADTTAQGGFAAPDDAVGVELAPRADPS